MFPFRRLEVWKRAHALAVELYEPDALAADQRYSALVVQIRRCAGSITANIAEGAGSPTQATFARYLSIALESAHELDNHLQLAIDTGCLPRLRRERIMRQIEEIKKMLTALRRSVKLRGEGKRPT